MIDLRHRYPGSAVVTGLTLVVRRYMVGGLASCLHTIVTAGTGCRHNAVIHRGRLPAQSRVATVASGWTNNMLAAFALCRRTVMATGTAAQHFQVINRDRRLPAVKVMAGFAAVGALDMGRRLGRCVHAVMTAETTAGYASVIKQRRLPRIGAVTITANIGTGDVRRMLADRDATVMAR